MGCWLCRDWRHGHADAPLSRAVVGCRRRPKTVISSSKGLGRYDAPRRLFRHFKLCRGLPSTQIFRNSKRLTNSLVQSAMTSRASSLLSSASKGGRPQDQISSSTSSNTSFNRSLNLISSRLDPFINSISIQGRLAPHSPRESSTRSRLPPWTV